MNVSNCCDMSATQGLRLDRRLKLQRTLEELLGSRNVYFEPPPNFKMRYPCIRYNRSRYDSMHADNRPYRLTSRYELTYIHKDPDDEMVYWIAQLPMCSHDRPYVKDNLFHDVFTIYY